MNIRTEKYATLFIFCVLLGLAGPCRAGDPNMQLPSDVQLETQSKALRERTSRALEKADALPSGKPKIPQIEVAPGAAVGMPDPAKIAQKFREAKERLGDEEDKVYVFVSLSMPINALKAIAVEARQANATLVFRGFRQPGLGPGVVADMAEAIKPVAKENAAVLIHPQLFDKYSVTAVPTYVVAREPSEGCAGDSCTAGSIAVRGDVSLSYALDHLSKEPGLLGVIAKRRAEMIARRVR